MRSDARGSAAPVTASPVPVQPQKPKTVSGGRVGPAGQRAQRGQRSGAHSKSPPIELRTEIPSALTPTPRSAQSLPSVQHRGRRSNPSTAPASSGHGGEARERRGGGRRTSHIPQMSTTTHARPQSYPMGPRLPPLVAAEARSDPPHRRLSGIEPLQPDAPKTTAGSAGPTAPARCRRYPAMCFPPHHTYRLQESGARRAGSPSFASSPALAHHHQAPPRRRQRKYRSNRRLERYPVDASPTHRSN